MAIVTLEQNMTDDPFANLHFDFEDRTLPRFVAVEGNIGVGKTTLAKRLAGTFSYQTLLEAADESVFIKIVGTMRYPHNCIFFFNAANNLRNCVRMICFHLCVLPTFY